MSDPRAQLKDPDPKVRRAAMLAVLREAWGTNTPVEVLPLFARILDGDDELLARRVEQVLAAASGEPDDLGAAISGFGALLAEVAGMPPAERQLHALQRLRTLAGFGDVLTPARRDVLVGIAETGDDAVGAAALEALWADTPDEATVVKLRGKLEALAAGDRPATREAAVRILTRDAIAQRDQARLTALLSNPKTQAWARAVTVSAGRAEDDIAAAAPGLARAFVDTLDLDAGKAMVRAVEQGGDVGPLVAELERFTDRDEYPRSPDADAIEQSDLRGAAPIIEAGAARAWHYLRAGQLDALEALLRSAGRADFTVRSILRKARDEQRLGKLRDRLDAILAT